MKKVLVLNGAKGVKFGLGERTVEVSDKMAVADAETIARQYPGVYVEVIEEGVKVDQAKAAKPVETITNAPSAK